MVHNIHKSLSPTEFSFKLEDTIKKTCHLKTEFPSKLLKDIQRQGNEHLLPCTPGFLLNPPHYSTPPLLWAGAAGPRFLATPPPFLAGAQRRKKSLGFLHVFFPARSAWKFFFRGFCICFFRRAAPENIF